MKITLGEAQRNALREIVALSVENQIKLEALEQVLVKTNPVVHQLYLGQIETLSKQEAVKLNRALTATPKEK